MKDCFRQSMAWLHTWTGLVLGWVLYFMFVTGTLGYLDTEIDRWMQPEAPRAIEDVPSLTATRVAMDWLQQAAPDASHWYIGLPTGRNTPYLRTFWRGGNGGSDDALIDLRTGRPFETRDTGGGHLLYRMHWQLHYLPDAFTDWFVSAATMFMFVALMTGIIIHKNLFKDFFTFRPRKGQRSWLDAHNALSVLTLPFQLMITYSGLIFMMTICMPLIITAVYGTDGRDRFFDDVFSSAATVEAAGQPATLADMAGPIAMAETRWGEGRIGSIEIDHPGDANARVTINGLYTASPLRSAPGLLFDGATGALLDERSVAGSASKATRDVFLGLHEGQFAGPFLRALYVMSGLLGAAMIATGLVLWTAKRRSRQLKQNRPHAGLALVERLNVGTIAGLPVGIAAYFWANRLLPLEMNARAEWEVHVMFIAWAGMLIHAGLRPLKQAWIEQFRIAAIAFALLPLINALTTQRHLGVSLPAGDRVMAGFDLAMFATGAAMARVAYYLQKRNAATELVDTPGQIAITARSQVRH